MGQVYTPERYFTRGRFSKKKFHEESIQEYAETFPIVGGDFSFYSIPEPSFWKKVFAGAPRHLKWDLKVPRRIHDKTILQTTPIRRARRSRKSNLPGCRSVSGSLPGTPHALS